MMKSLSQKLKLDAKYFIENSLYMIVRYSGETIMGIAMGIIFSRYVSKEVYGQYQLILSFITTVGFISLTGFNKALWTDVPRGKDGCLKVTIDTKMKWSLLGTLMLLILAGKYFIIDQDMIMGLSIVAGALTFPLNLGGNFWGYFLDSKKEYKLTTLIYLPLSFLSKAAIVFCIFFFKEALLFLVMANVIFASLKNYIGIKVSQSKVENNEVSKDFKQYGFFLTKIGVARDMLERIDSLLIGLFIGPTSLAVYTFALLIPNQLTGLIGSVINIIIPKLGENSQKDVQEKIKEKAIYILLGSVLLIVFVILVTPWLITTLFTESYSESIIYSQIITGGLILYVFEIIFGRILTVNKHKKEVLKINVLIPIVRGSVITIGFIFFGIMGVAVAHIISRTIMFLITISLANKTVAKTQ